MSSTEALDADVVEEHDEQAGALVPVAPVLTVAPQVEAVELVQRLDVIERAMNDAMKPGVDYGNVPGTDKPALLKPGAEKLGVLFQLDIQMGYEKRWGPGDHLTVVARATAFHSPTGSRLGSGEGVCSTREKKYGKRKAQRMCPTCNQPAVIRGKQEYGGGWLCFAKKGGCGAKWDDGSDQGRAFAGQNLDDIENPDLPDTWNTVLKMAAKRARVDVVLAVTAASALFTQDVEDQEPPPAPEPVPVKQGIGEAAALELLAVCKAAGINGQLTADFLRDTFGMPSPLTVAVATLTPEQAQRMRVAAKKYEDEHRQPTPEPEATDAGE